MTLHLSLSVLPFLAVFPFIAALCILAWALWTDEDEPWGDESVSGVVSEPVACGEPLALSSPRSDVDGLVAECMRRGLLR
jgi:hypothetical protein